MLQDCVQSEAQAFELSAGEAAGAAAGADSGAEEALVGVDVADAGEQCLVEQGGLDGQFAAAKEGGKGLGARW